MVVREKGKSVRMWSYGSSLGFRYGCGEVLGRYCSGGVGKRYDWVFLIFFGIWLIVRGRFLGGCGDNLG